MPLFLSLFEPLQKWAKQMQICLEPSPIAAEVVQTIGPAPIATTQPELQGHVHSEWGHQETQTSFSLVGHRQ